MKTVSWLRQHGILLTIIFVGFLLRIYKLDFQSIWIDEVFSMIHGDPEKSYGEIYQFIKNNDPHPPLYYFSLHFFFQILGESTFVARFLSVLFGIGGMVAVYNLAKELFSRRVALIATGFLAINVFHIAYSQEARMYAMLFLTTTLSFLYLVRFIRLSNLRSAIIYGFFAALMIYSHFYALFTLFAQYIILLYFVILAREKTSKKFLFFSLAAGMMTLILYIPAIFIFLETSKMSSIWIPMPKPDNFAEMFKEFFGQAEIVVAIMIFGLITFVGYAGRSEDAKFRIDPNNNRLAFAFFVSSTWVLVTYVVPLICSYLKLPMLVNRYFIGLLPAILILIAAGIDSFRNQMIKGLLIIMVVLFSFSNLFIERSYYDKLSKTQWRELTNAIKERNVQNSRVVLYWHWLMPHFFKDSPNMPLQGQSLDEYIAVVRSGAMPTEPFWYMDGHERKFELSSADQEFLNQNYILRDKIDLFDCWARYYEPLHVASANEQIGLWSFRPSHLDSHGQLVIFNNAILRTKPYNIEKGRYELIVKGKSTPEVPIDNENAHIIITLNDKKIADFNIAENPASTEYRFPMEIGSESKTRFTIQYDNDKFVNGKDRNLILSEFSLMKK